MIQYNPKNWFRHVFLFHKSDTLRMIWKEIIIVGLYTAAFAYVELHYFNSGLAKNTVTVHSLIGFAISLLLVFRTNTAYDRWWEGRKQWGALVNNTRNMALRLSSLITDADERAAFNRLIGSYPFAMKEHLREGTKLEELNLNEEELNHVKSKEHKPNAIAALLYGRLKKLKTAGKLSSDEYFVLDKEVKAFTDIIGACERIKKTPIPFSYSLYIKKVIVIYVGTIPLGFVPTFGYWTIPITIFIFYVFVSFELLAEEIEDPFGRDANDLPTDGLCNTIKGNVEEILVK